MVRKLAAASLLAALALLTLSVVWAGLNWPPPLWILEYGLPGAQGPKGRVARIEGIEFVEVPRGYVRVLDVPALAGRSPRPANHAFPALRMAGLSSTRARSAGASSAWWTWVEFPERTWIRPCHVLMDGPADENRRVAEWLRRDCPLPVRETRPSESAFARTLTFRRLGERGRDVPLSPGSIAFTLRPDQEHLVEPYLVEGE